MLNGALGQTLVKQMPSQRSVWRSMADFAWALVQLQTSDPLEPLSGGGQLVDSRRVNNHRARFRFGCDLGRAGILRRCR